MPDIQGWSKEDFVALLLCYAANADMEVTDEEVNLIIQKAGASHYRKANSRFKELSDHETIEMIIALKEKYFPGENGTQAVHQHLLDLFKADGELDSMERMIGLGLERLF